MLADVLDFEELKADVVEETGVELNEELDVTLVDRELGATLDDRLDGTLFEDEETDVRLDETLDERLVRELDVVDDDEFGIVLVENTEVLDD